MTISPIVRNEQYMGGEKNVTPRIVAGVIRFAFLIFAPFFKSRNFDLRATQQVFHSRSPLRWVSSFKCLSRERIRLLCSLLKVEPRRMAPTRTLCNPLDSRVRLFVVVANSQSPHREVRTPGSMRVVLDATDILRQRKQVTRQQSLSN